ncbi:unnamed protein product [Lathyrus sativus]|nr:unnamed protein product [Lathyrus sativus]
MCGDGFVLNGCEHYVITCAFYMYTYQHIIIMYGDGNRDVNTVSATHTIAHVVLRDRAVRHNFLSYQLYLHVAISLAAYTHHSDTLHNLR